MKIGITLNEVLRDFISQLKYVYKKYYNEDLIDTEITDWDLIKFFKFNDKEGLNNFLYSSAALEIFGHADQLHNNIMNDLNSFIANIIDEEEHEVFLISRDAHKARPATLFFLTKLGFTGNNIKFVLDTTKKWDDIDILITANPIALESKPEGKISVKVNTTYNVDIESDYEVDTLLEVINNEELFSKIINNKEVVNDSN